MANLRTPAGRVVAALVLLAYSTCAAFAADQTSITYEGKDGPGKGKHVVLLSGDEEYRSEEALPMLAKILSQRHGFKCTVLFALDPDGTINPDNSRSLPGAAALDSADAIVMSLRFRAWPDDAMKHFADAYNRGVPIIGLRTSTHAFNGLKGAYAPFNEFGKKVLGEKWVSHWGSHGSEATLGVVEPGAEGDPVLRGVGEVFGPTDVYEAAPPADAKILMRGRVVKGMKPTDPPAQYKKKRADKGEQDVNTPMMPIAWTRVHKNESGKENRILCTTMGAATDLESEGLRRLVVNGVYWGLGLDVPAKADVTPVDEYKPTKFGFKGFRRGLKPSDHALGTVLPAGTPKDAKPAAEKKDAAQGAKDATDRAAKGTAGRANASIAAAEPVKVDLDKPLALKKGDHVAIVGNTLADRLQHEGTFESLIHAKFPELELVFRNLAVAGDEVATRARSENFGSPDEWLGRVKADVVFGFFGFNESFKGQAGLEKYKADLDKYLKSTLSKNYSGKGAPQIVLFSPIAGEKHRDPNFPDASVRNADLQAYAAATAEVAKANGVRFVDLMTPSRELYAAAAKAGKSLTINGMHLSDEGNRQLAPVMFQKLFGETAPGGDIEKLRQVVNEKNFQFHQRYRTVDGYNVYGGRSKLAFPSKDPNKKIQNYDVMQEEMAQRDVLTANRDPRVWAVAKGGDLKVDDSNLPPVTEVPTNKKGNNPDGSWTPPSGEDAIKLMDVHQGLKVNLFASEEQFPELVNPVQMAWDTKGRLWVAAWRTYPERWPTDKVGDSLIILEDTNGDGKADKCTNFLSDLNSPTGFQFYKDGVIVMQAPDVWFVRDTDGDGKGDWKERILMGVDSADSHHTTNAMCYEPGGAIYLSDGVFHRSQIETANGPVRNEDAAIYRFEPRTGKLDRYAPYGFANPHGRVFDYWGNDLITDATGNNTYFGPAISGLIDYPAKHKTIKQFWERPSRPCPATWIVTSRHFPEDWQNNFLNLNVISFQGVYRVKVKQDGSGLAGESLPHLISSKDIHFRPICMSTGPDGALYLADWTNLIIGHMQHHIRDPNRGHKHGRVYRITYEGRPLLKPAKIDGQPIAALLDLLKVPENQVREWAKIELDKHDSAKVIPAVQQWAASLDKNDPAYEHHLTEALWVHQWHNVVDAGAVGLLKRMLRSPEPQARAAATRVLTYWRDRVPEVLPLLKVQAGDEDPRVRLMAVRAASFFKTPEAVDVALAAAARPLDYYLEYVMGETMRQLEPVWKNAMAQGQPLSADNAAGVRYLMRTASVAELLKLPKSAGVLEAILTRPDVVDNDRFAALQSLADVRKTSRADALLNLMDTAGKSDPAVLPGLARLLPMQPAADLKPLRQRLEGYATAEAHAPAVHSPAWAAMAMADDSFDAVWAQAAKTPADLEELLWGIPSIYSPEIRSKSFPKAMTLLSANDTKPNIRRAAIATVVSTGDEPAKVAAELAKLIERGEQVADASRGLRALPRGTWAKQQGAGVAKSLVAWAKKVPADQRTNQEFVETIQFATDLAGLLPQADAAAYRKDLKELRVAVFVVTTLREQMRYDTNRLVVEAGKPVEIIFENTDFMPHNLVVVKPGTRDDVGKKSSEMRPDQLDKEGRSFIPKTADVLAGTKLLENGQKQTLKFVAPKAEGEHEYVCTFPGHWEVMWGKLIVVKDVDAYLQANPTADAPAAAAGGGHQHHH